MKDFRFKVPQNIEFGVGFSVNFVHKKHLAERYQ